MWDGYIKKVLARCAEATEGPWNYNTSGNGIAHTGGRWLAWVSQSMNQQRPSAMDNPGDQAFIAHARTDLPRLANLVYCIADSPCEHPDADPGRDQGDRCWPCCVRAQIAQWEEK